MNYLHFDFGKQAVLNDCLFNKDLSLKPENFPTALISKWQPAHVTLFSNGKGMITGVICLEDEQSIINVLTPLALHQANFQIKNESEWAI